MNKEIEYTKFETYGYYKQSEETEELRVVVSFGKVSLLLKDVNDSVVSQWSFPSISVVTLPNGDIFFSPDDDGFEKLRIDDKEMIDQLKKVIQKRVVKSKNYQSLFLTFVITCISILLAWNAKSIMINIATSITPPEKIDIIFEDIIKIKKKQFGRMCLNSGGQQVLERLTSEFEFVNKLNIVRSDQPQAYIFPNKQIFLTENFATQIKDPIELLELLNFANHANRSNTTLKNFFSQHSFFLLITYIAGYNVTWDSEAINNLNSAKIQKEYQLKVPQVTKSISGLEWVRVQNICT